MRRRHIAPLQPLEVHIGAEGVLKVLGLASYGLADRNTGEKLA